MQTQRTNSFPPPALATKPLSSSASDLTCHSTEQKQCDDQTNNYIKWNQVVMVNEHKEPDDSDDSDKKSKSFWKRNRKRSSNKIGSNPSASILVVSTRKQHKKQPLGVTLRQETSNSGSKLSGVYLIGIAPHSPFRAVSRFVPHGSKILLVNGQPCPPSVKEVSNRLYQVPTGAVLTLHFEVDTKNSTSKKALSKLSIFRRSNSSMLNPVDEKEQGGADYAFHQNLRNIQQRKLPPSILKTPKYSKALTAGCNLPSPMEMLIQTAALPYQAVKMLHDEAVTELDQLGKFLSQSWTTTTTPKPSRFSCGDATTTFIEETNNRWASIKADELSEF